MRSGKINWPAFFKPVCVLSAACGVLWLIFAGGVSPDNFWGLLASYAGGVLFAGAGVFGLLGKPRALVPLLDFFALAAAMTALLKVGLVWWVGLGLVSASLYLICCDASTHMEGIDKEKMEDYSELHPYWENMENWKKQFDDNKKDGESDQTPRE